MRSNWRQVLAMPIIDSSEWISSGDKSFWAFKDGKIFYAKDIDMHQYLLERLDLIFPNLNKENIQSIVDNWFKYDSLNFHNKNIFNKLGMMRGSYLYKQFGFEVYHEFPLKSWEEQTILNILSSVKRDRDFVEYVISDTSDSFLRGYIGNLMHNNFNFITTNKEYKRLSKYD
jgi:hypothetical protein